MSLFIDTWGWLALRDEEDPGFPGANEALWAAVEEGRRFYTTDYVLDETITAIYGNYGVKGERVLDDLLAILKKCDVGIETISSERFEKAVAFRRRYRDKPKTSFTDLTTMVVMRELGITNILTGDQHFAQVNLGFRLVPPG